MLRGQNLKIFTRGEEKFMGHGILQNYQINMLQISRGVREGIILTQERDNKWRQKLYKVGI